MRASISWVTFLFIYLAVETCEGVDLFVFFVTGIESE